MSSRLSGKTRLFLSGNFLSMLGTGLVLPFMIIYLHQARRIALAVVGVLLAAGAATGLIVVLVCGALMDRVGARGGAWHDPAWSGRRWRRPRLGSQHTDSVAGRSALRGDVGTDVRRNLDDAQWSHPEPALQQRAFAVNFATQNMALGVGAVVAAVVVKAHHPGTFQVLFSRQRPFFSSFRVPTARAAELATDTGSQ